MQRTSANLSRLYRLSSLAPPKYCLVKLCDAQVPFGQQNELSFCEANMRSNVCRVKGVAHCLAVPCIITATYQSWQTAEADPGRSLE